MRTGGILGVFAHEDALVASLRSARAKGVEVADVYTPVPVREVQEILSGRPSPVRFFTLAGALAGLAGGLGLALWSSAEWNLVVGGKPVTSIVPFLVVGFEGTILIGALATLAALLLLSRLPARRFPAQAYRPEFSKDRYGLWLVPGRGGEDEARAVLEGGGAIEIVAVGGEGRP